MVELYRNKLNLDGINQFRTCLEPLAVPQRSLRTTHREPELSTWVDLVALARLSSQKTLNYSPN